MNKDNFSQKKENESFDGKINLQDILSAPVPMEYRPVSFWFLNHYLREDELRKQIREMAAKGFGGIMLHGRDGLRSGYLNPEWCKAVAWCIDEAATRGMDVWLYDELNYPSGPVDGRIFDYFPDADMKCLVPVIERSILSGESVSLNIGRETLFVSAVFSDGSVVDLKPSASAQGELLWTNESDWPATILAVAPRRDPSKYKLFPDYLDKKAMEKFVDLTYEWYAREFGSYFGTVIKGEFTDNSCASFGYVRRSIPWTGDFPERFKTRTGRAIGEVLPGVFLSTPTHREDRLLFWRFINEEYLESFVKPIDESCRKNGIASTGHYCIEDGNSEHVRQLGDRFAQKRNQGLPAVDMLGTDEPAQMADLLRMRHRDSLSVSIPGTACPAYFSHNSRVMCECMGLACDWALDLAEIRRATGLLAVLGVDIFVPHGLYYSIAGHRKWECGPDHYHNPMWEFYQEWTGWISKISYLTSHSERTAETALLYPVTAQQAHIEIGAPCGTGGGHPASDRGTVCDLIDFTFRAAGNLLLENNIPYEIIDEKYVQAAEITGDSLMLPAANGKASTIKILVLPAALTIEAETLEKLTRWRKNGGRIIALNSPPQTAYHPRKGSLISISADEAIHNLRIDFDTEEELQSKKESVLTPIRDTIHNIVRIFGGSGKIVSREWRKWGYDFCMLHNISREAIDQVGVTWRGARTPLQLDLESSSLKNVANIAGEGTYSFSWDFPPAHTLLLVAGDGIETPPRQECKTRQPASSMVIEGEWEFKLWKPNALPLHSCSMSVHRATQRHVFQFTVAAMPDSLGLAIDPEMLPQELLFDSYFDRMKCHVNGIKVDGFHPGTLFDRWIFETDISKAARQGVNELAIEISAGLLEQNRRVEPPIIFGSFSVLQQAGIEAICAPVGKVALGDWSLSGFPYYSGMASYRKMVEIPSDFKRGPANLSLGALANAAEVVVNGEPIGRIIAPPWGVELPDVGSGEILDIEVRVINTPSNLWAKSLPSGLLGPVEILKS